MSPKTVTIHNEKRSIKTKWHHTWHLTCDIIGSILSRGVVCLWVVLIKLTFENTQQAGDPVV